MSVIYECRVNGKEFTIIRDRHEILERIAEIASWEYFYEHKEDKDEVRTDDSGNPTEDTGFTMEVKNIEDEEWSKFDMSVSVEPVFCALENYN